MQLWGVLRDNGYVCLNVYALRGCNDDGYDKIMYNGLVIMYNSYDDMCGMCRLCVCMCHVNGMGRRCHVVRTMMYGYGMYDERVMGAMYVCQRAGW